MARTSHVSTLVALLILKFFTMAKHNLFLGQARGKVGSVVFSRLNGVQITRAYNPSPKNPKSWAQATQRAAFASISQYYKVFKYLIEQGQQGIKVGQPSIQDWQSRTLKQLIGVIGSTPMVLNAKGVQYPQLLPISLTNGSLPSLSYDIRGVQNSAGDTHYGLCLTFGGRYTTTEALAAMTLGDVYAMTPGLQRGFQLTFALLGWSIELDMFDYYNRAFAGMRAQYVIAEDADETLPFFVAVEGSETLVQINPAILTSSWGERFTPRWGLRVIDGTAVAYLDAPEYVTDGSGGIVAGCCITSYYNGSAWARSTSPMAIAADWATIDQTDVIETYQRAAKSTSSDLYLNQAKTQQAQTSSDIQAIVTQIRTESGDKTFSRTTLASTINLTPISGNSAIDWKLVGLTTLPGITLEASLDNGETWEDIPHSSWTVTQSGNDVVVHWPNIAIRPNYMIRLIVNTSKTHMTQRIVIASA